MAAEKNAEAILAEHDIRPLFANYPTVKQRALLGRAYDYAKAAHADQKRDSGEPYFIHPCEVARILIGLGMDANTVSAGLLHDVIEDTGVSYEQLEKDFGSEIARLVDGVSKLGRLDFTSKEEMQAENLRKMFLAMAKDIRVILIKLADRLHNMRTLQFREVAKQKRTARETLEIYAPLAHRLGISRIEWELEDLCLSYLEPEAYKDLVQRVALKRSEREQVVENIISVLKARLDEMHIKADIAGRPKHFYSIYRKMQKRAFEQIYDLTAIRVIVESVKDCYAVLGVVHTLWKPIPGRFKDYIAMPKENMYQSLHTTLMGSNGIPFEIQIRTAEMHRTAEYGIAAHWKYKEGGKGDGSDFDERLAWLRQLMEWQNDLKDPSEFMNTLKIDLFSDQVFVFTPKGDVVELPQGATPLDFAYGIHSAIGHKCVGARINGKMVPLDTKLKTGDIVEIITASASHGPSRDWLNIVKTSNAKNRIRQWLKREFKEENTTKGREMLEDAAKRHGYSLSQLMKNEWLEGLLKRYTLNSVDDLYAAVGFGGLGTGQVLARLMEQYRKAHKGEPAPAQEKTPEQGGAPAKPAKPRQAQKAQHGIIVKGEDNMLVRLSHCCNPVPGDDIVGYITRGRGVSVHRRDCTNLKDTSFEPERLIEVAWEDAATKSYTAEIQIVAVDRAGLLADLINAMTRMDMQLRGVNARVNKSGLANVSLMVEISDTEQLEKVIKQILRLPEVMEAFRVGA
nr:bifunctional (p)ppGpp synthetase/guanosine-3',5'-bis(diphosphate) 3'-pyrophosphohydrolase [Maliibacterium massiliense]